MAYMIARHLDPGPLTEMQVDLVLLFGHGLTPVKEQIVLLKCQHHADDVLEMNWHLRILVKDSTKKLQATNEHKRADHDGRSDVTEPLSKY